MGTLITQIGERALEQPRSLALAFRNREVSYGELAWAVREIAHSLEDRGVGPGDRVLLTMASTPEAVAAYLGIIAARGVAVALDRATADAAVSSICKRMGPSLLVWGGTKPAPADLDCSTLRLSDSVAGPLGAAAEASLDEQLAAAGELAADESAAGSLGQLDASGVAEGEALAKVLFTSGSTGVPKGVMLSNRAVLAIASLTVEALGLSPSERVLLPLPLHHSYGIRVLDACLIAGAAAVLQAGFTFGSAAERNIVSHGCTVMVAAPASIEVMRSQMGDAFEGALGRLRALDVSSGALSPRQRRELCELLPQVRITNTWGSTETGGAILCDVRENLRGPQTVQDPAATVALGRPLPGVEVRLEAVNGAVGRLAVRTPGAMSGYWDDPALTAETLRDGWVLTADLVREDGDGTLYLVGRANDVVNVGGEKVSPAEVEAVAQEDAAIAECACVGVPDDLLGQVPVLFVVASEGFDEDSLVARIDERLGRAARPRAVVGVGELPRGPMGKLDRRAIRGLWDTRGRDGAESAEPAMAAEPSANPVLKAMLERRSVRSFTDEPLDRATLELLCEMGWHAPSGHNLQTWRFTVLTRREDIEALKEAALEAAQRVKIPAYGWVNPTAMILVSNDQRNPTGCQDASAAAENILLAAHAIGLGAVWLGTLRTLRDEPPVGGLLDDFGVPATHCVWAVIAIGHPAETPRKLRKKSNVVRFV